VNHPILESKSRKICMCTAMLYEPAKQIGAKSTTAPKANGTGMSHWKLAMAERWLRWKHRLRRTIPEGSESQPKTITIKTI